MSLRRLLLTSATLLLATAAWLWFRGPTTRPPTAVAIEADDIGGVVTGPTGPEAGVWVIAETRDLPTTFRKIVVTDDQGRFLLPDLPFAEYQVWVRGYGLVDSARVRATPGRHLALTGVSAPDARAAAQIYPANYWYSMLRIPAAAEFPMPYNGEIRDQSHWISTMKSACNACHQVGGAATRDIPASLGQFHSTAAAWDRRVRSGPMGPRMSAAVSQLPRQRILDVYADWTDRIRAGDVPPAPPRPQGLERNVVLTQWEWGGPTDWVHSQVATDTRNPTVNASGPVYGLALGTSSIAIVDPRTHTSELVRVPTRDDPSTMTPFLVSPQGSFEASPYWGTETIWSGVANLHNPMLDHRGLLWIASSVRRDGNQPPFCKEASTHPSAQLFPLDRGNRQAAIYDPKTKEFTLIDTCFSTHHLIFDADDDNTVYFSGSQGIGWVNTRVFEETKDEQKAQGWCLGYLDSNDDGRIDPKEDAPINGTSYGIIVNPVDHSIWYSVVDMPGKIVRIERGDNPPASCRAEVYEPPLADPKDPTRHGFTPRGIDVDRNGIIWTGLSASGHLASFDRRKCSVLSGPSATGQHCPEGWTLYQVPGPRMKDTNISADFLYYNWVDQFDTFGLGVNVPIASGSGSDSLLALLPDTGQWVTLRVPYPLGFYSRGLDGRIDDPNAGWKGRGLWALYGTVPTWHIEGGKGTPPILLQFQMRPNPLSK